MKKDYLFRIKTLEDIDKIFEGSVIYVRRELKKYYTGEWTSKEGTYNVKVPKNKCVKLDDLE
jgi:hypothetical protein